MINFVKMPALNSEQDIMLHISIRLDQQCMVRNTYQNNCWQREERLGLFEFKYYETFEITILAEFDHYKIAVNGQHIANFAHRIPLHLVQYMTVKGDGPVEVERILLEQNIQAASTPVTQFSAAAASATTTTVIGHQPPSAPTVYVSYQSAPQQPPYNSR
jgi:hypothetical protein